VTALSDRTGCAAAIVRGFLSDQATDTSCGRALRPPDPVLAFPATRAEEPPVRDLLGTVDTPPSADEARTLGVVRDTIADVLWRWDRVGVVSGRGLRGGVFISSAPFGREATIRLTEVAWVADATLSGTLAVDANGLVVGTVHVRYPGGGGDLDVRMPMFQAHPALALDGQIDGRPIDVLVEIPAPI